MKNYNLFTLLLLLVSAISSYGQLPGTLEFNMANTPVFNTDAFRHIAKDGSGRIWVGTNGEGVYVSSPNPDSNATWTKTLDGHQVRSITADQAGNIWIGSGMNGVQASAGGVRRYFHGTGPGGAPDFFGSTALSRYVYGIEEYNNQQMYSTYGPDFVGGISNNGGLGTIDGVNGTIAAINNTTLSATDTRALAIGKVGDELWISSGRSCGAGSCQYPFISIYDPSGSPSAITGASSNLPFTQTVSSPTARAFFNDTDGNIWVGGSSFIAIRKPDSTNLQWIVLDASFFGLPSLWVNEASIVGDTLGNLFIGTRSGLLKYSKGEPGDRRSWTVYTAANSSTIANGFLLPGDDVRGFLYDTTGLWIATSAGIVFWPGDKDSDGDGLTDREELYGIDGDGDGVPDLDIATLYGADPFRPDIFVEIDYMSPPRPKVIQIVTDAFANSPISNSNGRPDGIHLHVEVDEQISQQILCDFYNGCYDSAYANNFGTSTQRMAPNTDAVLAAKREVFRYGLWVAQIDGENSAGVAGLSSYNFLVSFQKMQEELNRGVINQDDFDNFQSNTFMHELGHNLGLNHGGGDDVNYKPNYVSIMSYSYLDGLRPFEVLEETMNRLPKTQDFSRVELPPLNENQLNEALGIQNPQGYYYSIVFGSSSTNVGQFSDGKPVWLGLPNPQGGGASINYVPITSLQPIPIDWNNNQDPTNQGVNADVNYFPETVPPMVQSPGEILTGHNDWKNLDYAFRDKPQFFNKNLIVVPEELSAEEKLKSTQLTDSIFQALDSIATTRNSLNGLDEYIQVQPSPFRDRLTITFSQPLSQETEVHLITPTGEIAVKKRLIGGNLTTLETSELPSGLYLLRILNAQGMKAIKVLKE